jgi:endonuclease YncB( thermonuclease family)
LIRLAAIFTMIVMVSAASAETLTGQASVIDADTIEVHGERIRLNGIDAPETRQTCTDAAGAEYRCGQAAALALADKIGRAVVTCEGRKRDRYRRLLATCSAAGVDLGGWLVEQGLAVAYRRYSDAYIPQEEAARRASRGLWAGRFVMPWLWRRGAR